MKDVSTEKVPRDGPVWPQDCNEIFIVPPGSKDYYQFVMSAGMGMYDSKNGWTPKNIQWNGNWKGATKLGKAAWYAEYLIPLKELGMVPTPGDMFRFNFCRNNKASKEYSQWSMTYKSAHEPKSFGRAYIAGKK